VKRLERKFGTYLSQGTLEVELSFAEFQLGSSVSHPLHCFRTVVAVIAAVVGAQASFAKSDVAELHRAHEQLSGEFNTANPGWRPQAPASGLLLFVAPDEYSAATPTVKSVSDARIEYAELLFKLATDAADAGQLSLAFQWATETLRENPDHAEARRVLGYERKGDQWLTPYGVKMFDSGKHWDAARGWLGLGDPISPRGGEQADAARHADIKNGWQVRTDHFLVTTNHSLAAGAELAAQLEQLYQIWRQLFAGFFYTEKEVRGLFAGERVARTQARPFRVFYYRDRDEYVNALRRRQPRIAETLGIYFDAFREAHFFASDERAHGTLFHEAVHQLFQESKPTPKQVGSIANFWVIEGVATYFETLTEHRDPQAGLYFTIGESTAGRLPAARERMRDGFYVPLAELTALNKDEVQRHPQIAKVYSQSSGLAAFLVDGQQGALREPLVEYLQTVYAGRDNKETLSSATGMSYADLDTAYRRYLGELAVKTP
jgi:hypothetical protein